MKNAQVYAGVTADIKNVWRRESNDGTFWMVFSDFVQLFTRLYLCRIFPDSDYRQYCIHGEHLKFRTVFSFSPRLSLDH